MSTVAVANIHFESTGNNRIQVDGSNVSVFQAGKLMMTSNSIDMSLSYENKNVPLGTFALDPYGEIPSYRVGDIITRHTSSSQYLPNFLEVGTLMSQATYPSLFTVAGSNNFNDLLFFPRSVPPSPSFTNYAVGYGNGVFVLTGSSGRIATSTDLITWTNRTTANTNQMNAVAHGNGVFVAVGVGGAIQSSTDAITWTNRTTANTNQMNNVAYGNGVFVAVGVGGAIQSSTNGTTWTNRTTANTQTQYGLTYGNGVFVSCGNLGSIQTSTNGTTWTNRTRANTNAQLDVAYGNGVFVTVGVDTSITTSTDGITWTNRTGAIQSGTTDLYGVAYGNGVFVAHRDSFSGSAIIQSSTDGITWSSRLEKDVPLNSGSGYDVAYGDGVFVFAGSGDFELRTMNPATEFTVLPPISTAQSFFTPVSRQYVRAL